MPPEEAGEAGDATGVAGLPARDAGVEVPRVPEQWASADFTADPDWEWTTAAQDSGDELRALWAERVDRSDAIVSARLGRGEAGPSTGKPASDTVMITKTFYPGKGYKSS
jgi:hypothetical protein